mmetsp:Transcript_664/g.843  ORF Transcript_664/g.843 Transcript_664/m.843 type:complete len:138 (+) Transcript_664:281-694(+)
MLSCVCVCIANTTNPTMAPGYTLEEPVGVQSQIRLNRLIEFNEQLSTAEFDLWHRLYWTDERLDMQEMFDLLPDWASNEGIELRNICPSFDSLNGCLIWMPKLTTVGALELDRLIFTIRLKPGGAMVLKKKKDFIKI